MGSVSLCRGDPDHGPRPDECRPVMRMRCVAERCEGHGGTGGRGPLAGWPRQPSPLGPLGVPVAPRRRQQPATGRGWWPAAVWSRPAPGLSRGGEPGPGRWVGEGPPVGEWEDLGGRGGGGRRSEVEVEGKRTRSARGGRDSPVCGQRIHQFASASGRFIGSRGGMGEGTGMGAHPGGLWCRWGGAASGDAPHVYAQTETYIYI